MDLGTQAGDAFGSQIQRQQGACVDLSIIVPTYNERQNIALLVWLIHEALGGPLHASACSFEVLVVDDGSPDGTQVGCGVGRGGGTMRALPPPSPWLPSDQAGQHTSSHPHSAWISRKGGEAGARGWGARGTVRYGNTTW